MSTTTTTVPSTTTRRVLFVLTSHATLGTTGKPTGAYLPEVAHPWTALRAAGVEVDFASPRGGLPPLDGVDRRDPEQQALLADTAAMAALHGSQRLADVDASRYDAIFFAGGHGTMWDFADQPDGARLAAAIYQRGGVVGAVCHGPSALVNVRLADGAYLVAGKRVAAFTNDEERAVKLERVVPFLLADALIARGAVHVPAPTWAAQVVVDGRLVTGQNPASARGVGQAMATLLAARAHAA